MGKFSFEAASACLLFLLMSFAGSCDRFGTADDYEEGTLCISFDDVGLKQTRSSPDVPDTSDFILTISAADGELVYSGLYGDCPESLGVPPGSYVVRAVSRQFDKPAFDSPQFGDEQCVVVPAGGRVGVRLVCGQMNSGIRLYVSSDFLVQCPESVLYLKSLSGKLMYSYSEKRFAYFPPGNVSVVMSDDRSETVLMTADLQARDMLSVKVSVSGNSMYEDGRLKMTVDTSRVWMCEECVIGGQPATGEQDVLTVAQARKNIGAEDVWVSGYIVGGDLTSASASYELPFKSRSNILLGPRSSSTERDACLAVQLPEGPVRDALNLADNPQMLRKKVRVKGDVVEPYFGMPGIKNTIDYQLF